MEDEPRGSRRCTRSRAAPDWTAEESLILVNEIYAVESEWGATLPSFQKWQQIVENCNALEVSRNLNQCKRKWDELLIEYRRVKHDAAAAAADGSLPVELFDAIDMCVGARGRKSGGAEAAAVAAEKKVAEEEEQVVMATDPDSDPEAQGRATEFFLETGTKKQRPRMKRKKRRLETLNPWGYSTSAKTIKQEEEEENININEKQGNTNDVTNSTPEPEQSSVETSEQIMATMLWENAMQITAILEGNVADDTDYKLADMTNAEAVETDFTRLQGDKLIDCFGKISQTLKQLCEIVQQNATASLP
ncbi:hypothetical protein ABFS83_05G126400 [Erythranthe nasuta]